MRQAIKSIIFYFLLLKIAAPLLMSILWGVYTLITTGNPFTESSQAVNMVGGQYLGMALILWYMWQQGYLGRQQMMGLPVNLSNNLLCLLLGIATIWLSLLVSDLTHWLPDLLEDKFDFILDSWAGIICVAVAAPVIEEIVFRGGITRALLKQYSPWKAILISAAFFGIFHINPAQIPSAFIAGIVFAWIYYKTDNIIPCCLIHILNNSLAVYGLLKYPDTERLSDDMSWGAIIGVTVVAITLFIVCWKLIDRRNKPVEWQQSLLNEETN